VIDEKMSRVVKILLIEDDEDDAFLTREYLSDIERFDFDIDWAPNATGAKTKMSDNNYDLFLIDYNLGAETGIAIIDFIREREIVVPAILLTGKGDSRIDFEASAAGAFDYLVKGELTPAVLERTIRYALSQAVIIKELDEKEKKYRSLFERSVDCIFLANQHFQMVDLNDSFLRFFGYKASEAGGLHISELFADKEEFEYCSAILKDTEVLQNHEVEFVTKNGERKPCLVNCVFIPDQADDFCCYQGIIRDLSFRKKAEADLLVAERLSMTGKLARMIAHEIRNPLTNLNLALENLKEEMPSESETVQIYTDIIQRNSNRIETLISDLLKSSKPKELQLELVSLNEMLDESLLLTKDRFNLNNVGLSKSFADDLPRIYVDREKLSIAVVNIIINGIEAIEHDKGEIRIETASVGNNILLTISDNGVGIEKSEIDKIFDPFYTCKPNGTGLGLTSTINILSSHNSSLSVKSEVGVGTTFTVKFKLPEM
jgi:PAS domain S-box-containing protein